MNDDEMGNGPHDDSDDEHVCGPECGPAGLLGMMGMAQMIQGDDGQMHPVNSPEGAAIKERRKMTSDMMERRRQDFIEQISDDKNTCEMMLDMLGAINAGEADPNYFLGMYSGMYQMKHLIPERRRKDEEALAEMATVTPITDVQDQTGVQGDHPSVSDLWQNDPPLVTTDGLGYADIPRLEVHGCRACEQAVNDPHLYDCRYVRYDEENKRFIEVTED